MEVEYIGTINEIKARVKYLEQVDDTRYDLSIKKHRNKRSLNANAYLWEIVGRIADKMRMGKEEVYKRMLFDYGQYEVFEISKEINPAHFFKYYEEVDRKEDKITYIVYRGSSTYDSREMSVLIDGVIREATELDIPTITDEEIDRLLGREKK